MYFVFYVIYYYSFFYGEVKSACLQIHANYQEIFLNISKVTYYEVDFIYTANRAYKPR
jgi:hypothetical protein